MANEDLIRSGTVSVEAGQQIVTGAGVSWANVREGDFFGAHVGLAVPIQSIAGSVITLAYAWPGATQVDAAYAIQPKGDVTRFQDRVRQLLETLTDGDLAAIAALDSAADTLPYATGHGTWDLASFPPAARSFIAGFFTPVQQGGGSGQLTNKIRLGWTAGNRINAQVDGVDQGSLWTDGVAPWSLAANGYQRLPNGLMMQWGSASPTSGAQSIVFPVAFTTLFNVKLTPVGGAAADTLVAQWANSKSPTGFSISTRRAVNGGLVDSIPFPCDWLALGTI